MRYSTLSTFWAAQALVGTALSAVLPAREADAPTPSPVMLHAVRRQASVPPLVLDPAIFAPKRNVTLDYEGLNATNALVHAEMKQPSVLLEHIDSIADIACSDSDVKLTFNSDKDYNNCLKTWPSKNFTIITNHNGTCDRPHERGIYVIDGFTFDNDTLSLTATTTKVAIRDHLNDAVIDFNHTGTAVFKNKRDLSGTISADLSGSKLIETDPLTIIANEATLESTVSLSGHVHYDFWKFKVDEFYVDVDYSSAMHLNVSASANVEIPTDLYNYAPLSVSVSAFSIPGIIDVGPMVEFGVGIEFAVTGSVDVSVDVVATIPEASIHLDLLDESKTTTVGWKPETNVTTDVSAEVQLQLNPYADLTVAMGISLFNGLVDASAGVEARPVIINAFAAEVDFTYTSTSNVTFTKPNDDCVNSAWFASTFQFTVEAFVTQFYTKSLYEVEVPIYKSQCWNIGN